MARQATDDATYGYGYDLWLRRLAGHDVAMAWGFGGQMIYVVKDLDMVVVMTTNTRGTNPDTFHGTTIMQDSILPAVR
jgi:CubicO group peptidase (beta-lactamase class C family)